LSLGRRVESVSKLTDMFEEDAVSSTKLETLKEFLDLTLENFTSGSSWRVFVEDKSSLWCISSHWDLEPSLLARTFSNDKQQYVQDDEKNVISSETMVK